MSHLRWGWKSWMLTVLALSVILAGCTEKGSSGNGLKKLDTDEESVIKVTFFDEQAFYMQYGNAFRAKFPNVDVEVISTRSVMEAEDPMTALMDLIDEQKPDVVLLSQEQYVTLSEQGMLYDLEAVIQQDQFDLDSIHPSVVEMLKTLGGGKLNGLAPSFETKALYYNKGLFDKYNIDYPTGQMSWEQLLQLAQRFPSEGEGDEQTYGLVQSGDVRNPFDLVEQIGTAKGLGYVNVENAQLTIDTPEWKQVLEQVVNSYLSESVQIPSEEGNTGPGKTLGVKVGGASFSIRGAAPGSTVRGNGPALSFFGGNSFITGKAAMVVDGSFVLNTMDMIKEMENSEDGAVNWDVVTSPVDPSNPGVFGDFSLNQIFAVNAQSTNLRVAWELVKYINSAELSENNSMISGLPVRQAHAQEQGHSMEAFYTLAPNPITLLQSYPDGFEQSFSEITSTEMKVLIAGEKTVDEVLTTIQEKGQDALTKAILDEDNAN